MRLSAEQLTASRSLAGAVRVVAGAGTGKTAVIADRFQRLVGSGGDPAAILVMTFSERAASEMRGRIEAALGDQTGALAVGTFHALALGWLREDGRRLGIPAGFQLLVGAERWILARELMWELGDPALLGNERPDDLVTPLLKLLERLKQELVPMQRVEAWCRSPAADERAEYLLAAVRLYRAVARRCRELRLLDFDDLLVEAVRLLDGFPRVREAYAGRYRHLMVDEYQDTNQAQERLVELLGAAAASVFVVGDDDQSIYRFRGASRANMERFLRGFPGARSLQLGTNRRSPRRVVAAARALIGCNSARLPKPIRSVGPAGAPVEMAEHADGGREAEAIAGMVLELRPQIPLREMALLVRTNAIARPLVAALELAGIPYKLRGTPGFYERPEVKDVIAYLRLLRDPADRIALARLLTRPPLRLADEQLRAVLAAPDPPAELREWAALLDHLRARAHVVGVEDLFYELMEGSRHLDALVAAAASDRERIAANVARFGELIAEFCDRRQDHSLGGFLDHLDLVLLTGVGEEVAESEAGDGDAVQVMTIHQAKGLEFEVVFVPALVEGRLPQAVWRDGFDLPAQVLEPSVRAREDHVAEERRLLYVAMTRARSRLFLSWAARYDGSREWRPSRFLEEIAHAPRGCVSVRELPASKAAPRDIAASVARGRVAVNGSGELTLSFSAASSYRECPRQYWYRNVLRLPAAQSVEARYGTIVHAALMRAGARVREGKPVGARALRDIYRRAWAESGFGEDRRRPALEALGWSQLKAYAEADGLASRPALVEHSFTADLDGWRLRGIIDRVDPPPTQEGGEVGLNGGERPAGEASGAGGAWRLVDYKTGAPMPAARLRRDLQLALYALGARAALGLDPLELEIVYLKTGQRVVIPAGEELLAEARRIGDEVAAGIRAGNFEARPERRRCQLCPYRLACPDAL